jgi:hypothetical protein
MGKLVELGLLVEGFLRNEPISAFVFNECSKNEPTCLVGTSRIRGKGCTSGGGTKPNSWWSAGRRKRPAGFVGGWGFIGQSTDREASADRLQGKHGDGGRKVRTRCFRLMEFCLLRRRGGRLFQGCIDERLDFRGSLEFSTS